MKLQGGDEEEEQGAAGSGLLVAQNRRIKTQSMLARPTLETNGVSSSCGL